MIEIPTAFKLCEVDSLDLLDALRGVELSATARVTPGRRHSDMTDLELVNDDRGFGCCLPSGILFAGELLDNVLLRRVECGHFGLQNG